MEEPLLEMLTAMLICILLVSSALYYLRPVTRQLLEELCKRGTAAEFWLRSAEILALSGSMVMVLLIGVKGNFLETLKYSIALSLAGLFISVLVVANSVWRAVEFDILPQTGTGSAREATS